MSLIKDTGSGPKTLANELIKFVATRQSTSLLVGVLETGNHTKSPINIKDPNMPKVEVILVIVVRTCV
jgi:hypothetical protein